MGILRIARLSALLAIVACGGNSTSKQSIGYIQVSSSAALDDARDGFFKALSDSGYVNGKTITILERNAQGDIPALSLIVTIHGA